MEEDPPSSQEESAVVMVRSIGKEGRNNEPALGSNAEVGKLKCVSKDQPTKERGRMEGELIYCRNQLAYLRDHRPLPVS